MSELVHERVILENNHTTELVELCLDPATNERVVRKIVKWCNREYAAREIAVTQQTSHPNVVEMVTHGLTPEGDVYLVYRYASNGDLFDYLAENPGLRRDVPWIARVFKSIALGVQHLHQHNILHRDLKLENIIMTGDGVVKVCDFSFAEWIANPVGMRRTSSHGITRHKGEKTLDVEPELALRKNTSKLVGTEGCVSPETAQTYRASPQTDVYGLGVMLYEMVTGRKAFPEHSSEIFYPSWMVQFDGGELVRFIQSMVAENPDERIPLDIVLQHEWLTAALGSA